MIVFQVCFYLTTLAKGTSFNITIRFLFFRPVRENDILTPDQGRTIAKEIGASYYEASVLTYYGVNEVFENVIRAALIERRRQRFWMTNLKKVQRPLLQVIELYLDLWVWWCILHVFHIISWVNNWATIFISRGLCKFQLIVGQSKVNVVSNFKIQRHVYFIGKLCVHGSLALTFCLLLQRPVFDSQGRMPWLWYFAFSIFPQGECWCRSVKSRSQLHSLLFLNSFCVRAFCHSNSLLEYCCAKQSTTLKRKFHLMTNYFLNAKH